MGQRTQRTQRTLTRTRTHTPRTHAPRTRTLQEADALIAKVARLMLFKQTERPGVPVLRTTINEALQVRRAAFAFALLL